MNDYPAAAKAGDYNKAIEIARSLNPLRTVSLESGSGLRRRGRPRSRSGAEIMDGAHRMKGSPVRSRARSSRPSRRKSARRSRVDGLLDQGQGRRCESAKGPRNRLRRKVQTTLRRN